MAKTPSLNASTRRQLIIGVRSSFSDLMKSMIRHFARRAPGDLDDQSVRPKTPDDTPGHQEFTSRFRQVSFSPASRPRLLEISRNPSMTKNGGRWRPG